MKFILYITCILILIINIKTSDFDLDANWMRFLSDDTRINQIIIPGTHDSGTCEMVWDILEPLSSTQSTNIYDQLKNGIRYFDIRLETNKKKEIFITHDGLVAEDIKRGGKYYLANVLEECVKFLSYHDQETIIIHLKQENTGAFNGHDLGDKISGFTIYNYDTVPYGKKDKQYREFYYKGNIIPTLGLVRGKIVFATRHDNLEYTTLQYGPDGKLLGSLDVTLGIYIEVPEMGGCKEYSNSGGSNDGSICYPIITDYTFAYAQNDYSVYIQDNYNIEEDDKWDMIEDVITNKVPTRFYNSTIRDYMICSDSITSNFYNPNNNTVLTINFMNMASIGEWWNPSDWFDSSIEEKADDVNKNLIDYIDQYKPKFHNKWFILDFPSPDVIRRIYQSNDIKIDNFVNYIVEISGTLAYKYTNYFFKKTESSNKRDLNNRNIEICLQRKFDKSGNDIIKDNYKCINNKLNQWRIDKNGKYYNIISAYDGQCLTYNDIFTITKCDKNNKNNDFDIQNGKICARNNNNKCLNGVFNIHPTILISEKYDNLSCSTKFAKRGIKCCSNQNTQVEYVDKIGNWGIENGELCGIGYSRCSFSVLGYDCCSSVNPEVVQTDENGNTWGFEDGQWCGIGEVNFNSNVRIRNIKNNSCLVTYPSNNNSNSDRLVLGDCDTEYSSWSILGNKIISDYTNKCLYVNNGIDAAMDSCDEVIDGKNDHYIHFDIIDDKYICVKYNLDSQKCFNGKNLRFITSKDKYSEWAIERPNNNVVNSIEEIVRNKPNLRFGAFKPITTSTVPISTTTSTPEPTSECHSILGYPCCSPEITQIISTDEEGSWSLENGNWCLINKTTTTTTTSTTTTTTTTSTTTTTTTTSTSTPEPTSECHSILGYPCCSPEITQIINTDEEGSWSLENGNWCLITDKSLDIINNTKSECPYDDYPCCSSNNRKFYFSDERGIWGHKNTNWGYENGYCIINDDISKYTKVTNYDLCIFDFYGYPCCSSNVTKISMTDDSGTRWGEENGDYCGYYDSKSDYKSYWFYHAESNKCLYAPENIFISDKVTLKTCDESDYSKWMTLESRTGFIYSVAYPNYCININSNDEITLGLCNNYAKISHTDSALFIPTLFEDKCIGLLSDDDINKDSISLRLNTCTNKLSDNFYVWNETDYKQNIINLGKYNYCSSNISEIVFTDDVGNWGVENGEWCLIKDN